MTDQPADPRPPRERTDPAPVESYRLGQPVFVHYWRMWRYGTITRVGRTQVLVNIVRNRAGERRLRWVEAEFVQPRRRAV